MGCFESDGGWGHHHGHGHGLKHFLGEMFGGGRRDLGHSDCTSGPAPIAQPTPQAVPESQVGQPAAPGAQPQPNGQGSAFLDLAQPIPNQKGFSSSVHGPDSSNGDWPRPSTSGLGDAPIPPNSVQLANYSNALDRVNRADLAFPITVPGTDGIIQSSAAPETPPGAWSNGQAFTPAVSQTLDAWTPSVTSQKQDTSRTAEVQQATDSPVSEAKAVSAPVPTPGSVPAGYPQAGDNSSASGPGQSPDIVASSTNGRRLPAADDRSTKATDMPAAQVDVKSAGSGPFSLSLVNDMIQIPRSGAVTEAPQSRVFSGKNDTQSVQIAIQAPGTNLTNVNVSLSDLVGANGQKIDASNIDLYREHYVQVTKSSAASMGNAHSPNMPGAPGWYADGLIPFVDPHTGRAPTGARPGMEGNGFNLQAGQNQPIWADIKVPAGTAPGDYRTTVTVKTDQGTQQIPLDLHVWNFAVPSRPFMQTSFNATGTNDAAVQEQLLENKISPVAGDPANEKKALHMGLTAQSVGFYSGAYYGHPSMGAAPSVGAIEAAKDRVNPAGDKNLEVYDYSADEIGGNPQLYPTIKQWAQNLHTAGVDNLVTMAPVPELLSDGTGSGKPAVDIFSMLPVQYDKTTPTLMQNFKDKGAQMWSYNTLVQDNYSPKWLIDFSPMQERLQAGFISQSTRLTGLLDWSVTNWSADPWNDPYKGFALPGEGALVLPGQAAGLQGDAPTIRLKALRDGIDDYNYTQMLTRRGNGAFADQVAKTVGLSFQNWTRDPVAVEQAHEKLGAELEREEAQRQQQE